jgi:hypothetical protein
MRQSTASIARIRNLPLGQINPCRHKVASPHSGSNDVDRAKISMTRAIAIPALSHAANRARP